MGMKICETAIVGAGLGGIGASIKLKEAGLTDFVMLERNAGVGGVWYENNYPGCSCDVDISLYQFSFARGAHWSHLFPRSAEVRAYAEELVDRYQLSNKLQLNTEVQSADWLADENLWELQLPQGDKLRARYLIIALGQLNRPRWPDIPGIETFAGPKVHSARWPKDLQLAGKHVGVVGSAASAVQLIPEVAQEAAHLTVFQRSANWLLPRPDRMVSDEEKQLMATDLEAATTINERQRANVYDNAEHFFWQAFSWTPQGREAYTKVSRDYLHEHVEDPQLRAKLTPDYPIGCKRILFVNNYYETLQQDNVELETSAIASIDPKGIVMQDGQRHDLDAIVFATGFETTDWGWSLQVRGLSGTSLTQAWADTPKTYLGITVHDFPNMFVMYGPNTNLGHNSILVMLEAQIGYILSCLQDMSKREADACMPSLQAQNRFYAELQEQLAKTVWADQHCNSWYKNDAGYITQNYSSHTRDYRKITEQFVPGDYDFLPQ